MKKPFVYMLDSGAYTIWRKGGTIDLERYAEFIVNHRSVFRGGAFNLDSIDPPERQSTYSLNGLNAIVSSKSTEGAKKSYDNWVELRKLGADTIPVYHLGDDEIYLKKYLDQTEYIGIGAVAKLETGRRLYGLDYVWDNFLKKPDGTPRCRIHGLGLTNVSIMLRYPWFSVDSTRAVALAAYGGILIPKVGKQGVSFANTTQLAVSNQTRNATVGKVDNFFAYPKYTQELIRNFCKSLGYVIDENLDGRKLNAKMKNRQKKDPVYIGGFDIPFVDDVCIDPPVITDGLKNLSEDWTNRFVFNMLVSDKFVEYWRTQGKTIRIYNVVGGGSVFEVFAKNAQGHPASRCLVSYARMSDNFLNRLREEANGN